MPGTEPIKQIIQSPPKKEQATLSRESSAAVRPQDVQQYALKDIIVPFAHEIDEKYIPLPQTTDILTKIITKYITTLDNSSAPAGVTLMRLDAQQETFLRDFKAQFKNYDPQKLDTYVKEFIKTKEGLLAGIKISEWLLATIQGSTGAYINEVQSHTPNYSPVQINAAGDRVIMSPHRNILKKAGHAIGSKIPIIKDHVGTPLERGLQDLQNQMDNRTIQEIDTNYYTTVGFQKGNFTYDSTLMSDTQKAYLQRDGIVLGTVYAGDDGEAQKQRITKLLNQITNARVDFYQSMHRSNVQLNMIVPEQAAKSAQSRRPAVAAIPRQYVDASTQSPHLLVEMNVNRSGLNIENVFTSELDIIRTNMATENTKRAQKESEATEKQATQGSVDSQREELKKEMEKSPTEVARLKELGENTPKLEGWTAALKKPQEIAKELQEKMSLRQDIIDRIDGSGGQNGLVLNQHNITTEYYALPTHKQQLKTLEAREKQNLTLQQEQRKLRQEAINQNARGNVNTSTFDNEIQRLNALLRNGTNGIQDRMDVIEATIAQTESYGSADNPRGQALFTKLKELDQQIGTKQAEQAEANQKQQEAINSANELMRKINPGHIGITVSATMQTRLETDTKSMKSEQKRIELKDYERSRKLKALEAYNSLVLTGNDPDDTGTDPKRTKFEGIQARAQIMQDPTFELNASADLSMYDAQYLRIIQVIAGRDAVRAGGEATFIQAIMLLPPEKIMNLYNHEFGLTITQISALDITRLNATFIDNVMTTLRHEANSGRLGLMEDMVEPRTTRLLGRAQQIKDHIDAIRTLEPDANVSILQANISIYDRMFYHYEDVDDLARRILERMGTRQGVDYFNITTANREVSIRRAQKYAQLIDSNKTWRRRLHQPVPATTT
ncbi:MAG: hypothetical protein Q7R95_11070 [bacterium]|nr:hypothetical protein [bacterium]